MFYRFSENLNCLVKISSNLMLHQSIKSLTFCIRSFKECVEEPRTQPTQSVPRRAVSTAPHSSRAK